MIIHIKLFVLSCSQKIYLITILLLLITTTTIIITSHRAQAVSRSCFYPSVSKVLTNPGGGFGYLFKLIHYRLSLYPHWSMALMSVRGDPTVLPLNLWLLQALLLALIQF